nr:unnamed protein product [Callosobruchus chinensis]
MKHLLVTLAVLVLAVAVFTEAKPRRDLLFREPVNEEPNLKACILNTCNQSCIRQGYPKGGVCSDDICICRVVRCKALIHFTRFSLGNK